MSSEPLQQTPRPLRWASLEGSAARSRPRLAGPSTASAAAEAQAALGRAAQQAAELLEGARAEAEAVRTAAAEAGRREGRAQGLADGRREAEAQVAGRLAEAEGLRRRAARERLQVLEALAGDVARLALDIAAQVLQREVEQSPEEVVALARRLLPRTAGVPVLRVHPSLAPVLEAEASSLGRDATVRADPSVAPGGLVVEGEDGVLDATVAGRLLRVAAALGEAGGGGG